MKASVTLETRKKNIAPFTGSRDVESLLRPLHFKGMDGEQASGMEAIRHDRAEPNTGYDFSQIPPQTSPLSSPRHSLRPESQSCPAALSDSRTCPFGGACHVCPKRVQPKLAINQPGDVYEQEADRVAGAVIEGKALPASLPMVAPGAVQRVERTPEKSEEEKVEEALKKIGEAVLKTPQFKELLERVKKDPLYKSAEEFVGTLPGTILVSAAGAGAASAAFVALRDAQEELPMQIPEIPLGGGRGVKLTVNGPLDKPTDCSIAFVFTEQAPEPPGSAKPGSSESEKIAAQTARLVAQEKYWRAHTGNVPGSPETLTEQAERRYKEKNAGLSVPRPIIVDIRQFEEQKPKTWLQLTPPTPSFGYQPPPPLVGKSLKLRPPGEQKKKEEELTLHRKASNTPSTEVAPPVVHDVLSSAGQPLDQTTRSFMEARFGHDFSGVRIHTDAHAAASARGVDATAYTVGSDIVFGSGQFSPGTQAGQRLLVHELAHVVQQGGSAPRTVCRDTLSIEKRAEMLPEQLRSAERGSRGEADDLPQTPGAPVPASSRWICGPNLGAEIRRVWSQVQSDFRGWSVTHKRNACLYLIQLFTPRSAGDTYALPGSPLPVALNKDGFDTLGLFQEGAGWQRRSPYFPRCGIPGTAAHNPDYDFDKGHEDQGRCSNTVTVGGQCWLMGTVNYGAFGVMMKLCHDLLPATEGAVIGGQMFASIERYIDQIQRSGRTVGQEVGTVVRLVVSELLRQLDGNLPEARAVVEEVVQYIIDNPALVRRRGTAGAADWVARDLADAAITALLRCGALRRAGAAIGGALGPAGLFSRSSMAAFITGYKTYDADDPGPPLRWACATYDGGPGATPSGGNRSKCKTTCPLTYAGPPFDYVWEPTKPRRHWP